jgi:peptidoglycan/xylan/chitin deacetylase (PgdA/CDA1 family)
VGAGRWIGPGIAAATGAGAAWLAPGATSAHPLTRRALPGLAGVGRTDHVALTFDDGPDPASTPFILDELDRLGWKATFFLLGAMTDRHPEAAAEVAARGHEIAVHGYHHRCHLWRTPADVSRDTAQAFDAVSAATQRRPLWFRPPYGVLSWPTLVAGRRLGLRPVLWSAWGRDWRPAATADTVARDVHRGLRPGATVLLHDSDCTSAPESWRSTLASLALLADQLPPSTEVGPLSDHFM